MRIGDIELYVESIGSGPPLVLAHGGPGLSHEVFKPTMEKAAEFARVVFYDQRGCGGSTPLSEGIDCGLEDHVSDLEGLRQAMGFERFILLGHSWGAYMALAYAIRHENRLETLILVSPPPPYAESEEHIRRWHQQLSPAMRREIRKITMSRLSADEKANRRLQVELPLYFHDLVALEEFNRRGIRVCGEAAQRAAAAGPLPDLRQEMAALRLPVRIIVGRYDRRTPPDIAEEIQQILCFARLYVLESSGHFPFLEQPKEFLKLIRGEISGR